MPKRIRPQQNPQDPPQELTPQERCQQLAAILARGVARYLTISR
jgi:hypothetical protein